MRALLTGLVSLFVALAVAGCAERTLKAAGQQCVATSECESGLLCDFGAEPAICAGEGSGPRPMIDATPSPIDAGPIDAMVDAPPVDASIDAML